MSVTGGLIALAAALAVACVLGITPGRRDLCAGIGDRAVEVTARRSPNSIWFVMSWAAELLTKRRAVDFCHVATAICPCPAA